MAISSKKIDYFNNTLTRYVNSGILKRYDALFSLFSYRALLLKNSKKIINLYKQCKDYPCEIKSKNIIEIDKYSGSNEFVKQMIKYLSDNLSDAIKGAYVHGSLGNYDENSYSDFDALVILKNSVFESKILLLNTVKKLHDACRIMYRYDPLQHHGWFIMTELDLSCYADENLPIELLTHSKALFPYRKHTLELNIRVSDNKNTKLFDHLSYSIINKINNKQYPVNLYQLKSLLSEFMLLPALYVQARTGRGVFKGKSFAIIRDEFSQEDWEIMDIVSEIRNNWHYKINAFGRMLLRQNNLVRRIYTHTRMLSIPSDINSRLTPDFYAHMADLIKIMQSNVLRHRSNIFNK